MRAFGLFVAIDAYPDDIGPLQFACADAEALGDVLNRRYGLDSKRTRMMLARSSSDVFGRVKVLEALRSMSMLKMSEDDLFTFFFAGHGLCAEQASYLLMGDSVTSDPLLLRDSSLPVAGLGSYLDQIPAGRQLLIIDACRHSQSTLARGGSSEMTSQLARDIAALKSTSTPEERQRFTSRVLLSACWTGQKSWEYPAGGHSWFMWHLLRVLEENREEELETGALQLRLEESMLEEAGERCPPALGQRPHQEMSGSPIVLRLKSPEVRSIKESPPARSSGPSGYVEDPAGWRRPTDGQVVVEVPFQPGGRRWFIDRFAVTCAQFSRFLNSLGESGLIKTEGAQGVQRGGPVWKAICTAGTLVSDARGYWASARTPYQPWFCAGEPWGLQFQEGLGWSPLPGCDDLPATLVTWNGADWYSRWVHDPKAFEQFAEGSRLPPESVWEAACTGSVARGLSTINHAGYWAGRTVDTDADLQKIWLSDSDLHRRSRPLPVGNLSEAASSCGAVQMLGNVWEWCGSPREVGPCAVLKGGCCYSPRDHCTPRRRQLAAIEREDPYIGFRCATYSEVH